MSRRAYFLAAALLALVAGFSAPPAARASCGDGLRSLNDTSSGHDAKGMPGSVNPAQPTSGPQKPCDGPACKRGSVPLVPAVPPTAPSIEDLSYLPCLLSPLQPDPGVQLNDHCSDGPARLARDIFHPPRLPSSPRLA